MLSLTVYVRAHVESNCRGISPKNFNCSGTHARRDPNCSMPVNPGIACNPRGQAPSDQPFGDPLPVQPSRSRHRRCNRNREAVQPNRCRSSQDQEAVQPEPRGGATGTERRCNPIAAGPARIKRRSGNRLIQPGSGATQSLPVQPGSRGGATPLDRGQGGATLIGTESQCNPKPKSMLRRACARLGFSLIVWQPPSQ